MWLEKVEVIQRLLEAALENLEMGAKHWTSRRNNIKTKVSLNKRIINLYRCVCWRGFVWHYDPRRGKSFCVLWDLLGRWS